MSGVELPITVLGAGGWIGGALVAQLRHQGRGVQAVGREQLEAWLGSAAPQGPVIYAIGLTADFRQRPHATVEAHVGLLSRVLQRPGIDQLLYLSSSRVYGRSGDTREEVPLPCLSSDPSDLYNLSKLLGEALVLQDPRPGLRAVRLSNVVGPGQPASTFVGALLAEARATGSVCIRQGRAAAKDYVALADVSRLLPLLVERGRQRLYNLGSGVNSSHQQVAARLEQQGVRVHWPVAGQEEPAPAFAPLRMERLGAEFALPGAALPHLVLCDNGCCTDAAG